jgi:2-polyprenyl-3-methyl-5-hydroxy-6-metoxy-1,4-benzoquinol methylase
MPSHLFGQIEVLRKYPVEYFRCEQCGFMQTEAPFWLEEAYSTAIARQDVGIMQRNLVNCELTSAVLSLFFPKASNALDFGAGHGVFVRLMRDRGFHFAWLDRYATNDYARGFEYQESAKYEFLTAFEVLEHLTDPVSDLAGMMELSDNVFVSTFTVPEPVPALSDWWYYSPTSGQHVSIYTRRSLEILAAHFGRRLLSHGSYHLFTKEPKSDTLFSLATRFRIARMVNRMYRRQSLVESDLATMTR